jgi:hypothetical protein
MIRAFAGNMSLEIDEFLLQRMWNIIHFIHTVIVKSDGSFNADRMIELFDGKIELDSSVEMERDVVLSVFRFSVVVLLLASVGIAPDDSELFEFMAEIDATYRALPINSPDLLNILKDEHISVVSMTSGEDYVSVVRLSRETTNWSIFALESEMIRGYWSNEAREILFLAMSSRERNSIQLDIRSLRNITNQSCNRPIGYPAYVSGILESYSEKD